MVAPSQWSSKTWAASAGPADFPANRYGVIEVSAFGGNGQSREAHSFEDPLEAMTGRMKELRRGRKTEWHIVPVRLRLLKRLDGLL
jgi:hypothetical protein